MKKSEIRKTCDITFTNKDAKAILEDLEKIEYKAISEQTTRLKKYLKELAGVETGFNEKIESAEFFDSISTEEIYKLYSENDAPPRSLIPKTATHRSFGFWTKEEELTIELIHFFKSKVSKWGEFMDYLREKSGKNNDLVQVVLMENLKKKSIKVYMNGELVIEEDY